MPNPFELTTRLFPVRGGRCGRVAAAMGGMRVAVNRHSKVGKIQRMTSDKHF